MRFRSCFNCLRDHRSAYHQVFTKSSKRVETKAKLILRWYSRQLIPRQIETLALSRNEEEVLQEYPQKLNLGERQAIALAQSRRSTLLSNGKRAVRYCQQQQIRVVNLVDILRLLWIRRVASQDDVRVIIEKMQTNRELDFYLGTADYRVCSH